MTNSERVTKFIKENVRKFEFKLNKFADRDIIEYVESKDNKNDYFKCLVKEDMKKNYTMKYVISGLNIYETFDTLEEALRETQHIIDRKTEREFKALLEDFGISKCWFDEDGESIENLEEVIYNQQILLKIKGNE